MLIVSMSHRRAAPRHHCDTLKSSDILQDVHVAEYTLTQKWLALPLLVFHWEKATNFTVIRQYSKYMKKVMMYREVHSGGRIYMNCESRA